MQKKGNQMEKLILSNGQEFELAPMGVTVDSRNKRRTFKFVTALTYEEIKAIFSDSANLTSIDYVLANGAKINYADCTGYKGLSFTPSYVVDDVTIPDTYTVEVTTDAFEKRIAETESAQTNLELGLVEVYELLLGGM